MSFINFNNLQSKSFLNSILFIIFAIILNLSLSSNTPSIYPLVMNGLSISLGLICFCLSIISYKLTANKKVLFLGSLLGIISFIKSVFSLGFISVIDYDLLMKVFLLSKFMITFAFVTSLFIEDERRLKRYIVFNILSFIGVLIFLFYFDPLPTPYIYGRGFTRFYLNIPFLNMFLLSIGILIYKYKNKSNTSLMDKMLIKSIWYLIAANILFIFKDNNTALILSNVLKYFSYYIFIESMISLSIYSSYEKLLNRNTRLMSQNNLFKSKLKKNMASMDKQNLEILSSALNASVNATLIISTEGEIIFKNKAFDKLNNISDELFKKENFSELESFINSEVLNLDVSINEFLNLKKSKGSYRNYWILKDGQVLNVYISFLKSKSSSNLIMVNMIDVTEKYNELSRMKSEFVLTISHELKTPINVILGSVQLMESLNKQAIGESYITKPIKNNCYRLMKLSNNIIDTLRIESDSIKLEKTKGNIISFVETLLEFVRPFTVLKSIDLIFDTDIEEKIIYYDKDKMERVLLNLLSNSIKFCEINGQILVSIEDGEDFIKINVQDSGQGLPPAMYENIFDKFSKFHLGLKRPAEGAGIGLFIVRSFVELHGGDIYMNRVSQGSSFTFTLPVEKDLTSLPESLSLRTEMNLDNISIELSDIY